MHLDDLLDERDRLLAQRGAILQAMRPAVLASDLDPEAMDDLSRSMADVLDDAFFPLLDPIQRDIEDEQQARNWRDQRAEILRFRGR